ncbi:hypothetical protein [Paenibacillus sp. FSL P4-0502]|uniref:hypothetical protein n=1 Tax=Paenibacillus sp. FSL P4-0502 TaxID=2975319 RepID=UPI0030F896CB
MGKKGEIIISCVSDIGFYCGSGLFSSDISCTKKDRENLVKHIEKEYSVKVVHVYEKSDGEKCRFLTEPLLTEEDLIRLEMK